MDFLMHVSTVVQNWVCGIRALKMYFFAILSALLLLMGCMDVVGLDEVVKWLMMFMGLFIL